MINLKKKIVAVVTTMTVAAWMIPGSAFAVTADELQAQINSLLATLAALQSQLATLEGGTTGGAITGVPAGFTFDANLKQGDSSNAVMYMQIVLNSDSATQVAASGVGSSGSETMYFGPLTKAAVVKFQEKYASEVLATYGLTAGTGFVGMTTRAKLNSLLSAGGVTTPTPTPTPTPIPSTEATVSLAADTPGAKQVALAATDAVATKIKFTGGTSGYTVSKIIIKRSGVSADADVSAIRLYDGTKQLGSSQALNTNTHKATFSSLNWQIPAGETKYLTMKTTIAAKGTATVGDSIKLGIDSAADITSTASLTGTFPMYGNALTIAGISVGELFVAAQSTPANATVLSGSTEQEIAAWQFTASSSEAVDITKISVTHVGSAAATDVKNIKIKYAGAQIGETVAELDSENKVTFDLSASPLNILASASKTVYAYADVSAGIWTSRTIIFEITQYTDVSVYGTNSGGAIEAANSDTAAFSKQTGQTMTIGQGTVTINIDAALNPASQNYVKGSTNRLMSAFKITTGAREGLRLVKLKLKINNGSGSATDVANVTLWDGSTQIAGPASVIGSYVTFGANTIGWDNTGIIDVPKSSNKTIQVKADIPTGATANNTVDLDIAANTDIWFDGLESQYDIDQSSNTLTSGNANLHTVTANGALALSLSANTPAAQTYMKGSTEKEFVRFNLVADSGEDINVTAITVTLEKSGGANAASGDFTNVKLLKSDGTQLGSTVTTPSNNAAFSFSLTVPASETVTLKAVADVPSTTGLLAAGGYMEIAAAADVTSEGAASSASITETGFAVTGKTMAIGEGSLTVSAASTPGDQNVIIGSTEVPVIGLIFAAGSAEDVRVTRVKLYGVSSQGNLYGDQDNLSKIALWDGNTRLTTKKGWDSSTATSVTFAASDFLNSLGFTLTKGTQKTITVKADVPSTGDADDTVSLGIASSSDLTMTGGAVGTRDITFVGLESNTTPTTTITYPTALAGVNFATNTTQAGINLVTLQSRGTLAVASDSDTPIVSMVAVGPYGSTKEDVAFLKVKFTASREAIDIKQLGAERDRTGDADFKNVSLWDGTTQLGVDQVLVNSGQTNSSTTFVFPAGSYWRIPEGQTKVLTIKADLYGTKSADQPGVATSDFPRLCLASSTAAEGVSSGLAVNPNTARICGNSQYLFRSKPTVAAASLPSTAFEAGTKTLFRWTITADSKGDIGWQKVVFDVSGSVQIGSDTYTIGAGGGENTGDGINSTATDGIYMGTSTLTGKGDAKQLIATSTLKIYDLGTGEEVTASSGTAYVSVWNYLAGGSRVQFWTSSENVVPAGSTKTYELRGDILYGGKAGDSLSTKISTRNTATTSINLYGAHATSTAIAPLSDGLGNEAGTVDGQNHKQTESSTTDTFIWTDKSGAGGTHSATTKDWADDYKVSGLPTATLTLSK